jgi:two-component system, LytTR family, response regulator
LITALVVDDEPNARERVRTLLCERADIRIAGECGDGESAVAEIRRRKPQLLLLDIQMPGLDGFGVLAALEPEEIPTTVFVTAYDEFAIKAFDAGAIDYVLKPIVPERFALAIERAVDRVRSGAWLDRLVVDQRGRMTVIPTTAVMWLEAERNYVRVHTPQGAHLMRATLTGLEGRLDPSRFMRVHRSAIVALRAIRSIAPGDHGDAQLKLVDSTCLVASRNYAKSLRIALGNAGR